MKAQLLSLSFLLGLLVQACCSGKVLVLMSDVNEKGTYSEFFINLEAKGLALDYKNIKDTSVKLKEYDDYLYDNVIIFSSRQEGFGKHLDQGALLGFVDSGHNILVATSSSISSAVTNLASESGVDFDDKGTTVFDHFNSAVVDGQKDDTLIAATDVLQSPAVFGSDKVSEPVLFRGIAQAVPVDAELVAVALSASSTAYSHDVKKSMAEPPTLIAGSAASLVTLLQARNNARITFAGSLELFSNKLFNTQFEVNGKKYTKSGNAAFTLGVALWTFQERGVLRAENLRHHIIGSDEQPSLYRVNDDVEVLVDIYEMKDGEKVPYKTNNVQIEFVMLHPYVRQAMRHNNKGTFSLQYKVPDVYGVFKYVLEYKHLGYSYIKLAEKVPVRPFKHNEYERFLVAAFPYYASAASTMAAFFLIGFLVLYHK